MTEEHKKARIQAVQAAFNLKGTTRLNKKLNLIMEHNFNGKGAILETMKYENGKVTVYDADEKKIETVERSKPKAKVSPKLRNASNEKAD